MKLEGLKRKTKMPKFQEPKFGISLRKGKGPDPDIISRETETELPQLKTTAEIADISVRVPASELKFDLSDPGGKTTVQSPEENRIKLKEYELKAEEVEAEEHQGCL